MKKVLIVYGLLVVVVLILAFARFNGSAIFPRFGGNSEASINDQKYKVEVAKDDKSRQVGLSNRDSLPEDNGMLFIFDKKGKYSFWMKNTKIPLDIIFISDGKIVHIVKNAKPDTQVEGTLPVYTTPVEADRVLEINAGEVDKHKYKNGDTVQFSGV